MKAYSAPSPQILHKSENEAKKRSVTSRASPGSNRQPHSTASGSTQLAAKPICQRPAKIPILIPALIDVHFLQLFHVGQQKPIHSHTSKAGYVSSRHITLSLGPTSPEKEVSGWSPVCGRPHIRCYSPPGSISSAPIGAAAPRAAEERSDPPYADTPRAKTPTLPP